MSKANTKTGRSRAWCFTLNNYTQEEVDKLKLYPCDYMLFGYEVGEEGTPHLQGFFYAGTQRVLSAIKKKTSDRIHLENARDIPASIAYCKKDGNFFEQGDPPNQGKRADLDGLKEMIEKRAPMKEVAQANFGAFLQFHKGLKIYHELCFEPRDHTQPPPQVIWLFGSTGTGKSAYPYKHHPQADIYVKPPGQWFDGYQQQPAVVLDDFDPSHMCFRNLLHLLDRYPHKVPVKGSFVEFNSNYIYITSDKPPQEMYPNRHELLQLQRRISKLIYTDEEFSD